MCVSESRPEVGFSASNISYADPLGVIRARWTWANDNLVPPVFPGKDDVNVKPGSGQLWPAVCRQSPPSGLRVNNKKALQTWLGFHQAAFIHENSAPDFKTGSACPTPKPFGAPSTVTLGVWVAPRAPASDRRWGLAQDRICSYLFSVQDLIVFDRYYKRRMLTE
ncbi:hypothetical protein H4Q26_002418 [Puccinia striiformis f. sp. tritici PST-130]|nr:hypothetical protein H4Q26_002418 [Puccinia striiformis f. sp. tritici PST-130]